MYEQLYVIHEIEGQELKRVDVNEVVLERIYELQRIMNEQGKEMSIPELVADLVDDCVDVWYDHKRKGE